MYAWSNLTTRTGDDIPNPDQLALSNSINELFSSPIDNEHPDTWLRCCMPGGPLYVLSIFQSGYAVFTKYPDADMTIELESGEITNINRERALDLFNLLLSGKPDAITPKVQRNLL